MEMVSKGCSGRQVVYLVDRWKTVEDAEHELGVADFIIRHLNAERIHQHLVQRTCAQWVW